MSENEFVSNLHARCKCDVEQQQMLEEMDVGLVRCHI